MKKMKLEKWTFPFLKWWNNSTFVLKPTPSLKAGNSPPSTLTNYSIRFAARSGNFLTSRASNSHPSVVRTVRSSAYECWPAESYTQLVTCWTHCSGKREFSGERCLLRYVLRFPFYLFFPLFFFAFLFILLLFIYTDGSLSSPFFWTLNFEEIKVFHGYSAQPLGKVRSQ